MGISYNNMYKVQIYTNEIINWFDNEFSYLTERDIITNNIKIKNIYNNGSKYIKLIKDNNIYLLQKIGNKHISSLEDILKIKNLKMIKVKKIQNS